MQSSLIFWVNRSAGSFCGFTSHFLYIKLTGLSYTIITQERLSIARLLNFGYIYKTILLCITMAVFSLTASLGADFVRNLRVLRCAKEYSDYSIVKIETTQADLLGDIDVDEAVRYMELTNLRIEEVYRQYYESNDALMIAPYNLHSFTSGEHEGFIYCNANAADYIDRLFGEYRDEINADVCIFIPDGVPEDDPVIQNATGLGIPDYAGRSWEPEVEIIHYHSRKTGFYISSAEDSLLTFVENPIVIYVMRTPDEIGVPLTDTHKASAAGNITFRTDDAMLRDLQARDNIRCEIIPIGETVQREFDSVKRICGALALICAVFIALNVFVSGFFAIILNESSGRAVSAAVSLRGRSAKCAPFRRSRRCLRFLRQYCSKCEIAPQVQLNHKQKDADVSASFL